MYTIGMSCCFPHTDENFSALQENGIKAIEVINRHELNDIMDYQNLENLAKKYDVNLWSMHLPYCTVDISAGAQEERYAVLARIAEFIKRGAAIGIDKFVMHPSVEPIEDCDRPEHMKRSMDSLNFLSGVAESCGGVIAVENLPRTCLCNTTEEMTEILKANNKLKVCFDSNHLLNGDYVNFMKTHAENIITIHISDYDFINERHWLPGEGKVDWKVFMETLKEINYQGVFMYEVNLKSPASIIRPRNITFADYVANAKVLFKGETPEPFGRPIENLGMWVS